MNKYQGTIIFWDKRCEERLSGNKYYDPSKPFPLKEIEEGIKWLVKDAESIIDFGCGVGNLLFKSVFLGITNAVGIDISPVAIACADKASKHNNMDDRTNFRAGGIELLSAFDDNTFDVAASFNTLDNIFPEDSRLVLKELNRILKPKSRMLVKLNDVIPEHVFSQDDYFEKVSDNFYKEKSGLYLWNLSENAFRDLVSPSFNVVKYSDVPSPKSEHKNRLFFLENKK